MPDLRDVLERLTKGEISVDEAERLLKVLAIAEIEGLARLDIAREGRRGVPEIILAEGKESDDLIRITKEVLERAGRAIISRAQKEHLDVLATHFQDRAKLEICKRAKMAVVKKRDFQPKISGGRVGVITAGTSDIPIAEEAKIVCTEMGCEVYSAYDVGVAGMHRIFPAIKEFIGKDVDVIIVVAGMEGALPSVVAGLVDVPVLGIPTSTGYGLGERGVAALMAMLQACPLGLAVVNIDGGVAGGVVAALMANRVARWRRKRLDRS